MLIGRTTVYYVDKICLMEIIQSTSQTIPLLVVNIFPVQKYLITGQNNYLNIDRNIS